jgi:hypothetical protein
VSDESLPIIEIHFVTMGPSGEDGPRIRMEHAGIPVEMVKSQVSRAIDAGGVLDLDKRIFHPWHSVICVNWYLSEATTDELERKELSKTLREQREADPHFRQ